MSIADELRPVTGFDGSDSVVPTLAGGPERGGLRRPSVRCAMGALPDGLRTSIGICGGLFWQMLRFSAGLPLKTPRTWCEDVLARGAFLPEAFSMALVRRFVARPGVVRPDVGERFCQGLDALVDEASFASGSAGLRSIVAEVKAQVRRQSASANRWSFLMIDTVRYARVAEWLAANSRRPLVALRLWAHVFCHLTEDGQLVLSRTELAAELGVRPDEVSEVVSELVRVKAMSRERKGSTVRYAMSPWLGTHLSHAARDDAQRAFPDLQLVPKILNGGADRVRRRFVRPVLAAI